jgi:ketosteroid isomerase-like protein
MKVAHAPILLVVVCGCAGAPTPPPQVAAPASAVASAGTTDPGARCAVWDRENEFARSVHDHDASVFAEHVLPGAVFVNGSGLFQGREAIVKGWDKIIKGDGMLFEWHPTEVTVTGDPHVALSRGPYWIEFTKADAKQRYLAGTFQSVWVKDVDGVWRVTIDGGTADPLPVTEADVQKVKDAIPAKCPQG